MNTSFDFVFFSLGGTEALTELAVCACMISPSLLGFFYIRAKWKIGNYKQICKNKKKGKIVKIISKQNIKTIMAIFHCNKGMQWQEKYQYLCQTLFFFSGSSTTGKVRWQGLCKLIICHWFLSKKLQTRLWLLKFKYQCCQTRFKIWVCSTLTQWPHTYMLLSQKNQRYFPSLVDSFFRQAFIFIR